MREIETAEAVGHVLCHDITQIIPGVVKDVRFRKGHVVTEEDIPVLLSLGKEHLYIWDEKETKYHENEAAEILCKLCKSDYMERSEVKEGKIELKSTIKGLLKANVEKLNRINSLGEIIVASRHPNTPLKPGDKLCGTRIIPLMIDKKKLVEAEKVCGGIPVFSILPFKKKKVGIVTTGNEVYSGRIKDAFGPVLLDKVSEYDAEVIGQVITDDKPEHIQKAIQDFLDQGAGLILCSGGMSVDPDDKTPLAIKNTGADIVSYGAPVLPGAMFLLSYYKKDGMVQPVPIVGLPGCVMYSKRTVFDLVLPRLMADDPVTKEELSLLGKGGLCLNCEVCHYPNCGFGKGW